MIRRRPQILSSLGCILFLVVATFWSPDDVAAAQPPSAKVLIVAGPSSHPPGTHEVAAGARLIEYCLKNPENMPAVKTEVRYEWPDDKAVLANLSTIVFIGDLFPPERLENREQIKRQLTRLMNSGCGMVCIHYATGLRKQHVQEDGSHPLLGWLGGYFASGCPHHGSVAKVVTATVVPEDTKHPVLNGWKRFTFKDEPYWNNYFGKDGMADNVTSLAYSMLPPNAPEKETVAWAIERQNGGRGVGIVMPHYYHNWKQDDLRTLVLNSVCWSAKLDVPTEGVRTTLPSLDVFQPEAVKPQPR